MKTSKRKRRTFRLTMMPSSISLFLGFMIITLHVSIAQKIIPGPILNSNPFNNTLKDVTLYEHDNFNDYFNGKKEVVTKNTPNLRNINNQTTGIVVPLGKKAVLYEFEGYQGRKITLYPGNYSHLNGWNDLASSIKIEDIPKDAPVAYFMNDIGDIYTNQVFQGFGPEKVDNNSMVCYDCFSKLIVIGPLSVVAFDYRDYGGRSNLDNPFREGTYDLRDWGLSDVISSLEITNIQYALSKTVLKKPRVLKEDAEKSIAVSATGTNTNVAGSPEMTASVEGCFEASATQSLDLATTVGISTAVRSGVSVGVEGVASASIEYELAAKLETTLTAGTASTVTESQCWTMSRQIPVPQGCEGKITLLATPQVQEWTIEKHYVLVDSEGNPIPGEEPKIVTGKLIVTKGIQATSNISLNEGCQQNSTLPPVTTSNPPISTSSNQTTSTNTPADTDPDTSLPNSSSTSSETSEIAEVSFCDGEGTVVGFYSMVDGNWEEFDTNGTSRFHYKEVKRSDKAIHLSDLQRKGVTIILNLATKEVLYSDDNNPTPFRIYGITSAF